MSWVPDASATPPVALSTRRDTPLPTSDDPLPRWSAGSVTAVILLGSIVFALWPALLAFSAPVPVDPLALTAHLAGMLAGYGVVVLVALMSRAPALERGIGTDVLARWHARGGRLVISLIMVHGMAAVLAWAGSRQETVLVAVGHVLRLPAIAAATVGTLILLAVAAVSARAARRRMPYEVWHAVHLSTYIALALSFVHELAGPDLAGHRWLQIGWALLYTHVFALLVRHRVIAPLRQAWRHRLRVAAVRTEAPGVTTIEVEGRYLDELRAESGQFFRWRFLRASSWFTAHPFSLSAPPTDRRLRLTVKALGRGSARLQAVKVGTLVLAEGPYGAMTASRRTQRNVLLVAGGVGITPMRALLETLPGSQPEQVVLVYRVRSLDQALFRAELDAIASRRGAVVHYLHGSDPTCLTPRRLLALVPDLADRDVYLCGPPAMAAVTRASVLAAGLPVHRLHEERFLF